jgi:endonuclease/exonuclease/phosphatase family metal-dependent hydrolase
MSSRPGTSTRRTAGTQSTTPTPAQSSSAGWLTGYIDATRASWPAELTTQTAQPYQVDRIFGSDGIEVRLSANPTLCIGLDDGLSDHLPISFTIAVPPRP